MTHFKPCNYVWGEKKQTLILFNCVKLSKLAAETDAFNLGHQYPNINHNCMKIKDGKIGHSTNSDWLRGNNLFFMPLFSV